MASMICSGVVSGRLTFVEFKLGFAGVFTVVTHTGGVTGTSTGAPQLLQRLVPAEFSAPQYLHVILELAMAISLSMYDVKCRLIISISSKIPLALPYNWLRHRDNI